MAPNDSDTKLSARAQDDEERPKGFFKLPPEIRVKIYELLVLPPPVKRGECCGDPVSKLCSPGPRLVASSCNPSSSMIRTFNCSSCTWRGADIYIDILAVNRQISQEAGAVLYENTRLVLRENTFKLSIDILNRTKFSPLAFTNIKHIQLSVQIARYHVCSIVRFPKTGWLELAVHLPTVFKNLKHATIHLDVDTTVCAGRGLNVKPFAILANLPAVDFLVEVHIVRAWDGDNNWAEMVDSRPKNQIRAQELDRYVEHLRTEFVSDLAALFEAKGSRLKLRNE